MSFSFEECVFPTALASPGEGVTMSPRWWASPRRGSCCTVWWWRRRPRLCGSSRQTPSAAKAKKNKKKTLGNAVKEPLLKVLDKVHLIEIPSHITPGCIRVFMANSSLIWTWHRVLRWLLFSSATAALKDQMISRKQGGWSTRVRSLTKYPWRFSAALY